MALYRIPPGKDEAECQRQRCVVVARATALCDPRTPVIAGDPMGEQPAACTVAVQYSWDCLRRLRQALEEVGRPVHVDSVLVPEGTSEESIELAAAVSPKVYTMSKMLMAQEFSSEGTRASFCHFVTAFPMSRPLEELQPPFVVLDGLESSHIIGQILRTAYHFGVDSVVASQLAWDRLDSRACRVSMGWAFHMVFHLADSLPAALARLQGRGIDLCAIEFSRAANAEQPTKRGNKWALVIGNEEQGVSPAALALCESSVRVHLRKEGSMNVAHAAAICLYELAGREETPSP